jgi:hypothetical protein
MKAHNKSVERIAAGKHPLVSSVVWAAAIAHFFRSASTKHKENLW